MLHYWSSWMSGQRHLSTVHPDYMELNLPPSLPWMRNHPYKLLMFLPWLLHYPRRRLLGSESHVFHDKVDEELNINRCVGRLFYFILNSLNSTAYLIILIDVLGVWRKYFNGWSIKTITSWAWKYGWSLRAELQMHTDTPQFWDISFQLAKKLAYKID